MEKSPENLPARPSSPPPPSSATLPPPSKSDSGNHQINSSLKSLNKSSYKISKPTRPSPAAVSPPPTSLPSSSSDPSSASIPPIPPQPPVYNIDKNNFREIVQKLTGSPVPPPVPPRPSPPVPQQPEVSSTPRLHRIRPPPLANLSPRPPTVGSVAALSPLPPLPAVGVTAESPISAYMRRLHSSSGTDLAPPPASPLGFGCVPAVQSPRTAYQMMMMSSLGLPTSPGVPPMSAPSPREGR